MSDGPAIAPCSSRLGQLQRGRGAGFLAALGSPAAARDEVLQCVLDDPRVDQQIEARDRYYGDLVVALDVPVEPIAAFLAGREDELGHAVLAVAWARGHAPARELLASSATDGAIVEGIVGHLWGMEWATASALPPRAATVFAARVAAEAKDRTDAARARGTPPAVEASMSIGELLEMAHVHRHERRKVLVAELCRRSTEADRRTLAWHAEHDGEQIRFRLAATVLGTLGDSQLLPLAESYFGREDVIEDPQRMLPAVARARRSALFDYVKKLPPSATLPLARAWHHRGSYFATVAGNVLAAHAEPADREWLERFVLERLALDTGWTIISELDALTRLGDPRSAPVFLAACEQVVYSWARCRALLGLARMPDVAGVAGTLREALWDSEDWAAEIACGSMRAFDPAGRARVGSLAADPLVDASLRAAAAAGLAGP